MNQENLDFPPQCQTDFLFPQKTREIADVLDQDPTLCDLGDLVPNPRDAAGLTSDDLLSPPLKREA